jgi:dUTP pyrophosphatase
MYTAMFVLYIVPNSPEATALYQNQAETYLAKPVGERDAGFDLYSAQTSIHHNTHSTQISQTCTAAVYNVLAGRFHAFWMIPRSSISRTHMRMSNSVGLIDAGYRGTLLAMVDSWAGMEVAFGDRYFQVMAPDLSPFQDIKIVSEIPGGPTLRGAGGFGSTGVSTILPSEANYIV